MMMNTGSAHPHRRLWLVGIALGLAVASVLALRTRGPAIPDPGFGGRRASVWLDEMVRTSGVLHRDEEHLRHLEARVALLSLGTQAVPVLTDAVLHPPPDGPLRRALRGIAGDLPGYLFQPGSFAPPHRRVAEASELLVAIRPPVAQALALLGDHLEPRPCTNWQAIRILAASAGSGPTLRSLLAPHFANPRTVCAAAYNLAEAAPLPTDALKLIEAAAPIATSRFELARLLGVLTPHVHPVPAWLTATVTNVGAPNLDRIGCAVALLEAELENRTAAEFLDRIVDSAGFAPWNHLTNAPAQVLCDVGRSLWRGAIRSPVTIGPIERLARREVEGWNERGLEDRVSSALSRIAPERAAPLFLEQLMSTNRDNLRIFAAGRLLRVEGTDDGAVRFLADHAMREDGLGRMAAEQLGEADLRCAAAVEALDRLVIDAPEPRVRSMARISRKRLEVRALERRGEAAP